MQVKAIVFDLDGTLLTSQKQLSPRNLAALTRAAELGIEIVPATGRFYGEVRSFLGSGVRYLINKALPEDKKDMTDECLAVFKAYYDIHKDDNTRPYDGVIDMLKAVRAAGLKSAIVSNKYDAAVQELKNVTFNGLVDFAVGEGNGIKTKPAPDGVLLALENLGVSRDEAVYVGDSEVDLKTAENSGLKCIAVTWGFRDRDFLFERGAKNVIDNTAELFPLVRKGELK